MPFEIPAITWGGAFQILTLLTIVLMFDQIATAERVDKLRRNAIHDWPFLLRKGSMILKLIVLCLTVAYGYKHGWEPWPPMVWFLLAADLNIASEIVVLRGDEKRLRRLRALIEADGPPLHS